MKQTIPHTLLACACLMLLSCDSRVAGISQSAISPAVEASQPPAEATPAAPLSPTLDENAALEKEIADLKAQEATLRLEMQQDQIAQERADLERQRNDLAKEKAALEAAASNRTAAKDVPSVRRAEPVEAADAPPPPGGRDYQMFYESLAPYGQWMETSEYGFVWQPTVRQTAGWRPYTVGRWADSDQGWTWISDEPFGWATYHYGRWALLERDGWIWVPGDTWAPAWVAWRNNADLVGWSPLPPETVYADDIDYGPGVDEDYGLSPESYTFMPVRFFDGPVYSHCYPVIQNISYFSSTTCVTRIVIRSGNVHCGGPERIWVNQCLGRPMTCYRIDRQYDWNDRHDYRPHFEKDRLSCYSPAVRTPWNAGLRPSRLQGRLENVKVVRRQEVFRGELGRRYQEAKQERGNRATAALQQEPVRRLAERHGSLEKIRSQRDQLAQQRPAADRSRKQEPPRASVRSDQSDQSEKSELARGVAARKELKERQEEVARLRQQREATAAKVKPESPQPERKDISKIKETPNPKTRGEVAQTGQAQPSEARQRAAEAQQRGQRENQETKIREETARREQAQPTIRGPPTSRRSPTTRSTRKPGNQNPRSQRPPRTGPTIRSPPTRR